MEVQEDIAPPPRYCCRVCGMEHVSRENQLRCESKPVEHDNGVRPGDYVVITSGPGAGNVAIVWAVKIMGAGAGLVWWDRLWHTVGLHVLYRTKGPQLESHVSDAFVTFDEYRKLPPASRNAWAKPGQSAWGRR